ncbi:MAG: cyclic nucleotide-binding domain-containing protein [Spongiibacteraceae bacterium]
MTTQDRIKLLQSMPFFGAVKDSSIALLLDLSTTLSLQPGEYFFRQGDQGDSLYILEQGAISIFKQSGEDELELREVNEGSCFGDLALIDLTPRSASVRAKTPCTAIKIPASALHKLYQYDCEQYLIIQMNIARELSRRLRASDERWFQLQTLTHQDSST